MSTTYLNPVKISVGTKITLTELGIKHLKPMIKEFPILGKSKVFEITSIKESMAEDELTELRSLTYGATGLKEIESGTLLNIDEDDEIFWAYFTNETPHFFNIEK